TALAQDVDAEATDPGCAPRAVVVGDHVDLLAVTLMRNELLADLLDLIRGEPLLRQRKQLAVDARADEVARLHVDVGGAPLNRGLEDLDHVCRAWALGRGPCQSAGQSRP